MTTGTIAPPANSDAQQRAALDVAEREFVLAAFAELKKRDDGELRVAVRRNKKSGVVEIVYCGVHEKQDLERLRKLYAQLQNGAPRTF